MADHVGPLTENVCKQFWSQYLKDLPVGVELPRDRVVPAMRSYEVKRIDKNLEPILVNRLRDFATKNNTTLFEILFAGLSALVYRLTGNDDVMLGLSSEMIGSGETVIPIRIRIQAQQKLSRLAEEIKRVAQEAYQRLEHATSAVPPESTCEKKQFLPFIPIICRLQRENLELNDAGISANYRALTKQAEPHEIRLDVIEREGDVIIQCSYAVELFGESLVRARLDELENLLSAVCSNPDCAIQELQILSDTQQQVILGEWNATKRDYPLNRPLHAWIDEAALKHPMAAALVSERGIWTYKQLLACADALTVELCDMGVGPDQIVGVCATRSADMVVALLGILKAGAAYLPLDPEYPTERLTWMVQDAECSIILQGGGGSTCELPENTRAWLTSCAAKTVTLGPFIDTFFSTWSPDISIPVERRERIKPKQANAHSLAYVIFTSGSTGRPKGVMIEHRGIVNRLLWMQEQYCIGVGDRVLQKTPYSFDVSVWEFFWPLMTGATLVMARADGHKDPLYLIETIKSNQITVCHFVPSMLGIFLDYPEAATCTSLRHVFASGEALSYVQTQRFYQRLPQAHLHNLYGPTEASVDVSYWECPPEEPRRLVPIGRPVANTQLYVLDKNGEPLPPAVPGELFLGGEQLARGYLKRPDLTEERFVEHPKFGRLYRTGDLARWLPDGVVDFMGRLDGQVKLRGLRIELGEIETQLMAQPQISEAVCAVRERAPGDAWLVAWVTARPNEKIDAAAIRNALAKQLPSFMIPQIVFPIDAFARLTSGKIDRKLLPDPFVRAHAQASSNNAGELNAVEERLLDIWRRVLGIDTAGVDDSFFDLGGGSLQLIQVFTQLRESMHVNLSVADLFGLPTIRLLAARIAQDDNADISAVSAVGSSPQKQRALPLPPLSPQQQMSRPLSVPEYYHASIGSSRFTLEVPCEVVFVLRGSGTLDPQLLQRALDRVAAVNPGTRLRMVGRRNQARWQSDGLPPRLRVLDCCGWDAQSDQGAEFIRELPLSLQDGPTIELIVAPQSEGQSLLIFRALHAVVDGGGSMHFLNELFRALRGEALLGSNASFSDVDLIRSINAKHSTPQYMKTNWLTGELSGDEIGDEFRRISLGALQVNVLAKVAVAMAEFSFMHSNLPALIAIPVDLRLHLPELQSTTNFSKILRVPLYKGDGIDQFRSRLQDMLAQKMDAVYPRIFDLAKNLPASWVDLLISRTRWNYRKKNPLETAVISDLGRPDSGALSCLEFKLRDMVMLPQPGSVFATLVCIDDRVEMVLNLPKILANNRRFDAFVEYLQQRLAD